MAENQRKVWPVPCADPAPKTLIGGLDSRVKENLIRALRSSRKIIPVPTNWVLLSAMVEAALYELGAPDYDMVRVVYAAKKGWLLPGVCGFQPGLAEPYINRGSLYLCSAVFLALGLGPEDPFWSSPDADWTAVKIWNGLDMTADHAILN